MEKKLDMFFTLFFIVQGKHNEKPLKTETGKHSMVIFSLDTIMASPISQHPDAKYILNQEFLADTDINVSELPPLEKSLIDTIHDFENRICYLYPERGIVPLVVAMKIPKLALALGRTETIYLDPNLDPAVEICDILFQQSQKHEKNFSSGVIVGITLDDLDMSRPIRNSRCTRRAIMLKTGPTVKELIEEHEVIRILLHAIFLQLFRLPRLPRVLIHQRSRRQVRWFYRRLGYGNRDTENCNRGPAYTI